MKKQIQGLAIILLTVFSMSFIMLTNAQTTVFNEDFEATLQVTPTGVPAWSVNTTVQVSGLNSYHAVVGLNSVSYFETNTINLTGYSNVMLEFQHICKVQFNDSARIFVSVNNGLSWQVIPQSAYLGTGVYFLNNMEGFSAASYAPTWLPGNNSAVPNNTWWKNEQFDISSIVANQSQVKFRFYLKDGNGDGANLNAGWFIDDIKIIAAFSELIPPVITLVPPILQDTVYGAGPFNINASITDLSGISYAKLFYKINTLPWDSVTMTNTTASNFMGEIPGQPYNTEFEYYIIAKDASPAMNVAQSPIKDFINLKPPPVFTLGTANTSNTTSDYPTPYGTWFKNHRVQYLILASELTALGMPQGPINSIAFDVEALNTCASMPNFTIKFKHTSANQLTSAFESGTYTTVWTHLNFLPVVGWNEHVFPTPFFWNGTSNIIVDICFNLIPGNYTQNASVKYTETTGQNLANYWMSDLDPACGVLTGATTSPNRANMKLTTPPNTNDYDAGVVQITEPVGVVLTTNPIDVKVRFKNYGIQTMTSVNIGWSLNGVSQIPFAWSGTLLEDVTSGIIQIGTTHFSLGTNVLKAWTSQPNGLTDQNVLNDTLTAYIFGCDNILSGTYTIDSSLVTSGTNFQSFDEAMLALNNCGVSGPVIFNIAPGIYNTRLVFNGTFTGASATNTVTFQGSAGTVIMHTTQQSDSRAAIVLNGAKYLRFNQLTITIDPSSMYGQGFQLINNAEDIHIKNCVININDTDTYTDFAGIVASGSMTSATSTGNSAHNVLIENNTIKGGYYGIIFYGSASTPLNSIVIRNNKVFSSYYFGISTNYVNGIIIEGNEIAMRVAGGSTYNYSLYLQYEYQTFNISKNNIMNSGDYGVYIANVTPAPGNRSLLSNNSIGGFTSTSTPYGIYITSSSGIDILYNSVNVNSGNGRGIHSLSSASGLRILNNTFVYSASGAGYAAYHTSIASILEHNYNNYFSSGSNFVFYGAARANLAALQTVNQPAGNDLNSVSGDPVYASAEILYPLGAILNNAGLPVPNIDTDILGAMRHPLTPDIGAYEYVPANADIALLETKLKRGQCITNNDSIYFKIRNIIGNAVDFSVHPLSLNYEVTGPVVSSVQLILNSGILPTGGELTIGFNGVDLSLPGFYHLKAYISTNTVNELSINDTLNNAHSIGVDPLFFDASPNSSFITTPIQTVSLSVNSNLFPPGAFFISEICHYQWAGVGEPVGGWPAYLLADDYVEITGVPNSDLGGYSLEHWNTSSLIYAYTFPSGTILSPAGTAIIAIGEMDYSVPSPANFYYHGNGSYSSYFSSSDLTGRILKDPSNNIIDAVGYNAYTFPSSSGVTSQHWSGTVPSATSTCGIRLNGPDLNNASNWVVSSATNPQNPNTLNNNVTLPAAVGLTGFSWSLNGIVTSVNSVDTIVGPWTTNGLYPYVATYNTPCGVFTDTVHITVFIPARDLAIQNIVTPEHNACYYISEEVTIKIKNLGTDTVQPGSFTASYLIDSGTAITETVNQMILSGDSILFTFTTPISLSFSGTDTIIVLTTYVDLPTDPFQFNDTIVSLIKLNYTPDPPIISDVDIQYATSAILNATAVGTVSWYSNPNASPVFTGNPYVTPILYDTTYYWVSSGVTLNQQFTFTSNLEGWIPSAPCVAPYTFVWDDDGGNGTAFMVNPYTSSGAALFSPVFNVNSDTTHLSFRHKFNTESCCDEAFVAYRLNGGSWTSFIPSTGMYTTQFAYIDPNVLSGCTPTFNQPAFSGNSGGYIISSGNIITTGANTLEIAFVFNSDASVDGVGWYIDEVNIQASGCPSSMTGIAVNVLNTPAIDVGPVELVTPVSGLVLGTQQVRVRVKNYGTSPVSNIPVSYSVNGGVPVAGNISATILPGDTVLYQFPVPFVFTAFGPYHFKFYTHFPTDLIVVNDTLTKTINNNPLVYCASAATSSYDGDIGNVTVSNLNNGNPQPVMNNATAMNTYSDYTTTIPAVELAPGYTYPISVSGIWSDSYTYDSYVKVFIDFNIDAIFDPVTELVFEGQMTQALTTLTGNVTIPMTATSGLSRMRVVMMETTIPSSVQPCGTYSWGETEDYSVMISPLLQFDGGVISIVSPNGIFAEGDLVDVILEVKNFGTDILTSIPLNYSYNGNPAVLQTWTGSLAPNQTVQINMPQLAVNSGVNSICATTEIIDDTNFFNDEACSAFWGLPGLTVIDDSFDGSTIFTSAGNVWQHGTPSGAVINSAFNGNSCWVTNLNGQYPSMATEYLVSPLLNFSGVTGAILSLAYWMDGEINFDGGYVQYTIDNGFNWTTLGVINDPNGYNWYDTYVSGQPGWSVSTNGWKPAFISLTALNNAGSMVKLRFVFRSNATIQNEGFAVDAVKIHVPLISTDGGVVEVVSPQGQSTPGGLTQVTVKLKNFGNSPLTSIPVTYKLSTGAAPSNATWTGNLNPGDETTFTFPQSFIGPFNNYTLCAFTGISTDYYKFNDTTCVALTPGIAAIDGGVIDILAPDELLPAGQTTPVTIQIRNFGSNALTNIPVQYSVNGSVQTTEIVMTTLNPGTTMNYTFMTTYTSQGTNIQLCAKTAIPSDAISANDQFCKELGVGVHEVLSNDLVLHQNIPNPANESTLIGFSIPKAGKLTFTLHNLLGQIMYTETAEYSAGYHSIRINLDNFAAGVYYYSITFDQTNLTRKLTVH
jgi:hypothetical protein